MMIASIVLALAIDMSTTNVDPCPSGNWQACPIPWEFPTLLWIPDVDPLDLDLPPADDVAGPELDPLPDLSAPGLEIPEGFAESLAVPELPAPAEPDPEEEDISEQVDLWLSPLIGIQAALEAWIGDTGALPDASGGDFETGFDSIDDEHTTAFEFASDIGESIGALFEYIRAIQGLSSYSIGTLILFVMACSAWLALNRFIVFALSVADMLWSLLVQGIQALGEALPWPW